MFFPVKMCKAQVIGLKKDVDGFISVLHEEGIAQVKEVPKSTVEKWFAREHFAQVSQELLKLRSVQKILPPVPVKNFPAQLSYGKALRLAKRLSLDKKVSKISGRQELLLARKNELVQAGAGISFFKKFDIDFSMLSKSEVVDFLAARIGLQNFLLFKRQLREQEVLFEATSMELDKQNIVALVVFEKGKAQTVKLALEKSGGVVEQVPNISASPALALKKINDELLAIEKGLAGIEKQFLAVSKKHLGQALFLSECLEIESQRAQVTEMFGNTQDIFVAEAFLPQRDFARLCGVLEQRFGQRVLVEEFSMHELHDEIDEVPTLLENPKNLSAFEFMTKFISMPQSADIDPTIIFAFVFPLLYGMMLGDVGYGVLSIVFALLIKRFSPPDGMLSQIASIWAFAAIPSIFFGIFFDEFFGFSHVHLLEKFGVHIEPLYHGVERLHNIPQILLLTIGTGFAVVSLGFFLGFVKEWRENKRGHAIAKLAWITLLIFGTTSLGAAALGLPSGLLLISAAGFVVSLAIIVKNEGIIGIVEIPSVAGNILSFARILAVGLASVVVAVTLNDLAFPSPEKGILLVVLLPIFLFGHAFNTFLGMFESLIQGARLNYVEFFSKFFSGGGKEFSPFKVQRKYSKRR